MFRSFCILLTSLTVMLHALLGCCLHHTHGHAAHGHFSGEHPAERQTDHDENHSHGHVQHAHSQDCQSHSQKSAQLADCDHQKTDDDQQNHDHPPCEESDCQFVSTPRTDNVKFTDSLCLMPSLDRVALGRDALVSLQSGDQYDLPGDHIFLSQPLHHIKQVWQL